MRRNAVLALVLLTAALAGCLPTAPEPVAEPVRSADWIAALPEGDIRRQVVLGCTPCHQLGPPVAHRKTLAEWREGIARMKKIDDSLDLARSGLDAQGRSRAHTPLSASGLLPPAIARAARRRGG